ncbi:MAG: Fur family transcriptional regulator [Rhodospirillaceae bacterium]|nr:Fur family transcriptional regulator [Rhodospirillaceae bacterium]
MGRTHDHRHCIDGALDGAERLCSRSGARLTPLRRRVLELVWQSHQPVGAYQVLAALGQEMPGEKARNPAPPTVYRALEFLLAQGLIHRLESRNAYIGCPHPDLDHAGQFLICHECGTVTELVDPKIGDAVRRGAQQAGFRPNRMTLELEGTCRQCADGPRA